MTEVDNANTGRVILDLSTTIIQKSEVARLQHPECAGVIIFARNYETPEQLQELVTSIRSIRNELLICVDQEGGRVQRLQNGFLKLPPLRLLGELYDQDPQQSLIAARALGWLMAAECLAIGIDFSFAPVLDLDYGNSEIIGNRAFHSHPDIVIKLATAYITGMHEAGMVAVGKHFPGHGFVAADSHTSLPVDKRSFQEICEQDLKPFSRLMNDNNLIELDGVMPAHVIYEKCDKHPAGFSEYWIKDVLRSQCQYKGVIFSDDLNMAGAKFAGNPAQRAIVALDAGCDLLLVCNDQNAAGEVLDAVNGYKRTFAAAMVPKLKRKISPDWCSLHTGKHWNEAIMTCKESGLL